MVREIAASTQDVEVRSWLVMEADLRLDKGLWQRTVEVVEQNLSTSWENARWSVVLWASGWAAIACLKAEPDRRRKSLPVFGDEDSGKADR